MIKMNNLFYTLIFVCASLLADNSIGDSDLDGIPDNIDRCPNTPFLHQVDEKGCTVDVLTLPEQSQINNMDFVFGYIFAHDEDRIDKDIEHILQFRFNYYLNDWVYMLKSGYVLSNETSTDTKLSIRKRFSYYENLKFDLGIGVVLPTYNFKGNHVDYTISSAVHYYKILYSLFTGFKYDFTHDKDKSLSLHNSYQFYLGLGHFFCQKFYANISLGLYKNKFMDKGIDKTISSMFYYKVNKNYFITLSLTKEIENHSDDDSYKLLLHYKLW